MSLRIYIKGTPKFSSPKRTTQALPFSPNFNSFCTSKIPHLGKRVPYLASDSRDPSVMHDTNLLSMDNPSHSFDDHSVSTQALRRKATGQNTGRHLTNKTEEQPTTDRLLKNGKELRNQKEIQDAIKEFSSKLNNRANIPEKQLRGIIKDSDNMILSLLEEVEQLTEMLTEKFKDNDLLKSFTTIPTSTQDYRFRPGTADDGRPEIEGFRKNESLLETTEVSKLTQENRKLTEEVSRLTESNAELGEEISLLREMASTTEKSLQKERESLMRLKTQAEELLTINEELSVNIKDKDRQIQKLEEDLLDARVCVEKFRQAEARRNPGLDNHKKNLLMELQSPQDLVNLKIRDDMNHTLSPFSREVNTTVWSQFKLESPMYFQGEKLKEDMKELQKRYDDAKNDNGRLMKIIEENQKVIMSLKEAFTDLEKRNNSRFEEIKSFYESKSDSGVLQEISNSNYANRTNIPNESAAKGTLKILSSISSSKIHSKKPSLENMPAFKRV